jgi:hypothetical protein
VVLLCDLLWFCGRKIFQPPRSCLTYDADVKLPQRVISRVGQNHIYIRCRYGIFGREITKYAVIYGVYIRFWPTLVIRLPHPLSLQLGSCKDTKRLVY